MQRTLLTMFVCWTLVVVTMSGTRAESSIGHTYGPRAVYSPFQPAVDGSRSSEGRSGSLGLVWQDTVEQAKPKVEEIKKPGRAFFLSALLPGLGQFYAGARTRGFVLFGIEAAAVTYALASNGDGNDWENKYEAFADEHWIEEKYVDDRENPTDASWYGWWKQWYDYWALDPIETELTHRLPETKDHDYYEMIGKYNQFVYGWDDVHDHLFQGDSTMAPNHDILIFGETGLDTANFDPYIADVKSAHREKYMDMRHESNRAFKRAKTMVGVILFNHVVSAIDAARSARNYNLKHGEVKTSLRMRVKDYEGEHIPQLVLTHRFY